MAHPKSLVHEFLDRKKAGEPFKSALKEAAFQAKGNRYDDDNLEDGKEKFELFKFTPRGLVDDEPVYVLRVFPDYQYSQALGIGGSLLQLFLS